MRRYPGKKINIIPRIAYSNPWPAKEVASKFPQKHIYIYIYKENMREREKE